MIPFITMLNKNTLKNFFSAYHFIKTENGGLLIFVSLVFHINREKGEITAELFSAKLMDTVNSIQQLNKAISIKNNVRKFLPDRTTS